MLSRAAQAAAIVERARSHCSTAPAHISFALALFRHRESARQSKKRALGRPHHATYRQPSAHRHDRVRHRFGLHARGIGFCRRIQDDRQPRSAAQRAKRAAELADDERRLCLVALFQADPDQPREREEFAHGLGARARRHAGHRPEWPGKRGQSAHRQRFHVHHRRLGHGIQDRRAQPEQRRVRLDQRFRRPP
jgi:hypothetical protein